MMEKSSTPPSGRMKIGEGGNGEFVWTERVEEPGKRENQEVNTTHGGR